MLLFFALAPRKGPGSERRTDGFGLFARFLATLRELEQANLYSKKLFACRKYSIPVPKDKLCKKNMVGGSVLGVKVRLSSTGSLEESKG